MLNDARISQFKKVYLVPGYTDLRRGIDGLASIVRFQFELDPYDKNTLLLCSDGQHCKYICERCRSIFVVN
ncbi:IS66 family insertion sequence element accessory protein TnpB [Clostridiaceae bacterium Marseille-Q4143]|nr:IS66 family insertion sequence element accessory protein TnpB [Clostridiaceae bacterium Marseille-Q4143]